MAAAAIAAGCHAASGAAPPAALTLGAAALLVRMTDHALWSVRALPALVLLGHPLTLHAVATRDARVGEGAALVAALALAHAGAPALALAVLAALAVTAPVQATCLAVACVPWLVRAPRCSPRRAAPAAALAVSALAHVHACAGLDASAGWRALEFDARAWLPELGGSWYLLGEAFLRVLPHFAALAWAHPLLYPVPLAIRFW
jgi:hypothetical protein